MRDKSIVQFHPFHRLATTCFDPLFLIDFLQASSRRSGGSDATMTSRGNTTPSRQPDRSRLKVTRQSARKTILLFVAFAACLPSRCSDQNDEYETSDLRKCKPAGMPDLSPVLWSPCFKCVCLRQNQSEICHFRKVICAPLSCSLHVVTLSKCCKECKGCVFDGQLHNHGEEWTIQRDPCVKFVCNGGIVTRTEEQCVSDCTSLDRIPGNCCSACAGCEFEGRMLKENATAAKQSNPCIRCTCQNGGLTCRKKVCPVLHCTKPSIPRDNECCPHCDYAPQRKVFSFQTFCYIRGQQVQHGTSLRLDTCTTCQCQHGTAYCAVFKCPEKYDCEAKDLIYTGQTCCPVCEDQVSCKYDGKTYKNNESWLIRGCVRCQCLRGRNVCNRETCKVSAPCPPGTILGVTLGSCCKTCIEELKQCVTFGDPHYRTFDGKFFSFQGACKYTYVKDCFRNQFSITVKNTARYHSAFSWTKTVTIKFGDQTVSLQQKRRVKVNNRRVMLPYLDYPRVDIREDKRNVYFLLNIGIYVVWDGYSYLEVKVSPMYKYFLCGLCGNYNGNPKDDFQLPDGSTAMTTQEFAEAWKIKSEENPCHSQKLLYPYLQTCSGWRLYQAHKTCGIFRDAEIKKCHQYVSPLEYFHSCITDVCNCPNRIRCECAAVRAYLAECDARTSNSVSWNRRDLCSEQCSGGSHFTTCGPPYKPTCHKRNQLSNYLHRQTCTPGCHCPAGFVWHNKECILESHCPRT